MRANITLLPGDGIGPEVVTEGVRALRALARAYGHDFNFVVALIGGCALDESGCPLPASSIAACRGADAVLLGAVGGPKWSDPRANQRPEQGLLRLREEFDLFANLRPVRCAPALADLCPLRKEVVDGTDILFVRELTGGAYFGPRQEGEDRAYDTMLYNSTQVRRVARVAFEAARKRRRKLASVDKANVLASSRLWRNVVNEVASEYPDVELEHILVDACAMHILTNPRRFDVVLAENLFGDILSDEASVLAGSLGMLPSASLGVGRFGVYEPIHGSAPDLAGKGIANPTGTILSCALLLRHSLGLRTEAADLERAVEETLNAGVRTVDLDPQRGVSTREFADSVLSRIGAPVHA